MSTVQRIAKNTAVLFAAQAATAGLGLALSILIARNLGDVEFGNYSFVLAFTAIFAIFLDLGFNRLIVRDVARDKSAASKYLGNVAIIKAVLSVVVFGLIALIINLMNYPHEVTRAVLTFGLYIIFVAFGDLSRATFRAYERMEYEALVSIMRQVVITSLGITAVLLGYGLIQIAYAFLVGGIFYFITNFFICRRKFARPKLEIDFNFLKTATKIALPLSFISIATIIYFRIDTVMLSVMKGAAVVGWYNAAHNLVFALGPIPILFTAALFPFMATSFISTPNSLKTTYERSLRYLLLLGLPLAVGTMLLSGRIILLFYGAQFAPAIVGLQILAWHILLFFMYALLANVLISINRQNQMAITVGSCALMNVVLNLALIPHFSYIGAAMATIATETTLFAVYFHLASKYLYRLPFHRVIIKPLIACVAMGLFIHFCGGITLAALIALAAVIYFVVLCLLKGLSKEDLNLLGQAITLPRVRGKLE